MTFTYISSLTNSTDDTVKLVKSFVQLIKNIVFFDNVYATIDQVASGQSMDNMTD